MKRLVVFLFLLVLAIAIFLFVRRSLPYSDRTELVSATINVDSIRVFGPMVAMRDKSSGQYYWFKSLTTLDHRKLDTLKSKHARIRYMKFLKGPLGKSCVLPGG